MELLNAISIPRAKTLFVARDKVRNFTPLLGVRNGVNTVFTLAEAGVNDAPSGIQIHVFRNGVEQTPGVGCDVTLSESGGVGTGFDTITFADPPITTEELYTHYVAI